MKPTAKSLITGETQPLNEAPGDAPGAPNDPRGPGGPPRRPGGPPRRPGGPARIENSGAVLDASALKDLVILDLLNALGNDPFFTMIANVALKGEPITPEVTRHFMDEAPKYADKMSPEVNDLMGKIAQMPMN